MVSSSFGVEIPKGMAGRQGHKLEHCQGHSWQMDAALATDGQLACKHAAAAQPLPDTAQHV